MQAARLKQVISAATHDPDVMAHSRPAVSGYAGPAFEKPLSTSPRTDCATVSTSSARRTYCSLVHDYGWQHEAFVEWLADSVSDMLLSSQG
jgi:hypothetical protein